MGVLLKTVFSAFLISRFISSLFIYMGHMQREFLSPIPGGWEGVKNWWLNPWTTYDSKWYIDIAINGYMEQTSSFFPLYPFLLKIGGEIETNAVVTGIMISNFCFLAALAVIFLLTKLDFNEKAASTTVWLLAFFPTTAFFSAAYTESLFLLLLVSSFYLARRGNWLGAGSMGLLASLTKNPGILISIALAIEYLRSIKLGGCRPSVKGMIGLLLPISGFLAVQAYFGAIFGSPFSGVTSQEFYYRSVTWPWEPVIKDIVGIFTLNIADSITFLPITFLNTLVVMLVFVFAVKYRSILRPSYAVLMLGVTLMHLTYARTIPPYTIGAVRYMSVIFPFTQLAALSANNFSRYIKLLAATVYLFVFATFNYFFGLKIFLG